MNFTIKKNLFYLLSIVGFVLVSLIYFSPVLKGDKIQQSDIAQYIGMAKQQIDAREQTGKEIYWSDRSFGGMPTFQLGALYPHNYIKKLDKLIRFLPRPADYLFLYFISFFILLCTLKVNPLLAFFGSLAFGFSTYFIIILGVGHNAKAHAIGYMPLVLSGVLLVYANKYIKGGLLFCIAMALELVANHFQMTYYLFLIVLIIGVVYLIKSIQQKQIQVFIKSSLVLLTGLLLALALNATSILATKEYAAFSTRGKSEITVTPEGKENKQNGLEKAYILSYSYGILETFNLAIPRFMGGSSSENAGNNAAIVKQLVKLGYPYAEAKNVASAAPTYWGDQPYIGAPAYIGAGIVFLFVLGLFLIEGKKKWWIIVSCILALLLSWGKNLEWFSELFINYFPLYNKFRAVTSIQVIIELCVPLLGIYTLNEFFKNKYTFTQKQQALYKSFGVCGGLLLLFVLFKKSLFSFSNANDARLIESAGIQFVDALREDRVRMFITDTLRSLAFVTLIAVILFGFLKEKVSIKVSIIAIGVLLMTDLVPIAWRYVNVKDFVPAKQVNIPFKPTEADLKIKEDPSHYRVYDLTGNPFNTARTSYFHNAIGGYHGAKPARMQQLYDFYISKGKQSILDMLNVKYFIFPNKKGKSVVEVNDKAMGNAWFVNSVIKVKNANEEILKLDSLKSNKEAIIAHNSPLNSVTYSVDSLAQIKLVNHQPMKLNYKSFNAEKSFAVFSEMYYQKGWKAFIDGTETTIIKTNYALRGLEIPKGTHNIEFVFVPKVIKIGSTISLLASILVLLLLVVAIWYFRKTQIN